MYEDGEIPLTAAGINNIISFLDNISGQRGVLTDNLIGFPVSAMVAGYILAVRLITGYRLIRQYFRIRIPYSYNK